MNKIAALSILFTLSVFASPDDLKDILALRPGNKTDLETKTTKDFTYIVTKNQNVIKSVEVEFNRPVKSETFLKAGTKGFCLIQKPEGHVPLERVFFFEMPTKRRYELTPKKEIKAILIQDMPGAVEHKPCTFGSL